ncbi:MAG: prepilin-type N-terminal cleavage/methylation domain-containing protein [Phycisphaerae bacterium]
MSFRKNRQAFSLVELIVVVVIIGILAAIAIPRFSRGAAGAGDSGVRGNLAVLRNAIELYFYEHGEYPGKNGDGTNAAGTALAAVSQLTMYSDGDGQVSATKTATAIYGPYLRTGIPACPVSPRLGQTGLSMKTGTTAVAYDAAATTEGWVYNVDTGAICVNSNATDQEAVSYDTY